MPQRQGNDTGIAARKAQLVAAVETSLRPLCKTLGSINTGFMSAGEGTTGLERKDSNSQSGATPHIHFTALCVEPPQKSPESYGQADAGLGLSIAMQRYLLEPARDGGPTYALLWDATR